MWEQVLGHEKNKAFLQRLLQPGNRPHALLFYGAEGIGKKLLAQHFAKTLLCLAPAQRPCGTCEACRLLDFAGSSWGHPDFIYVEPEAAGKDIKIEQIKDIIKEAAFPPVLSANKLVLIDNADYLTEEAANSLLKLLEEPPADWMFILVAAKVERLLPTILSRVIQVRFQRPTEAQCVEFLHSRGLTDRAEVLIGLAQGSPGRALTLQAADIFAYREEALAFLKELPLFTPLNYLAKQAWIEKIDKVKGLLFAEMLTVLLQDLLLQRCGAGEQLINIDVKPALLELGRGWSLSNLRAAVQEADAAHQAIAKNVAAKTVLEAMALKLNTLRRE